MHLTEEQLKAHLMETNEEFRRLAEQHCEHKKKLQELASRSYLTPQQQLEETQLKKIKLRLKDQMQQMMDRHRAQQPV
ncbi:MAG: YdcH family protein [Acidobacteriota bacterium]